MLTVFVVVVVCLGGFGIATRKQHLGPEWMFVLVLAFILGIFVSLGIGGLIPKERLVRETKLLHNLYEDATVSGGFFLGSGSIDETEYLFFNTVTEDGMIHPEKVEKYTEVYIVEGSGQPRLEIAYYVPSDKWKWWINGGYENVYIFYIPEGSVDSGYRVK
ncbi:MAG: hypothetical protein WA052_00220 [Microgenomates group bacterium]